MLMRQSANLINNNLDDFPRTDHIQQQQVHTHCLINNLTDHQDQNFLRMNNVDYDLLQLKNYEPTLNQQTHFQLSNSSSISSCSSASGIFQAFLIFISLKK